MQVFGADFKLVVIRVGNKDLEPRRRDHIVTSSWWRGSRGGEKSMVGLWKREGWKKNCKGGRDKWKKT